MALKPNFKGDAEDFKVLREHIGSGYVRDVQPSDVSIVAPHVGSHPETVYVAASGIPPSQGFDFQVDEPMLAVEWVRREPNPNTQKEEPEVNTTA